MALILENHATAQAAVRREGKDSNSNTEKFLDLNVLAAINAIGVCYYVRISAREEYLQDVARYFRFVSN